MKNYDAKDKAQMRNMALCAGAANQTSTCKSKLWFGQDIQHPTQFLNSTKSF